MLHNVQTPCSLPCLLPSLRPYWFPSLHLHREPDGALGPLLTAKVLHHLCLKSKKHLDVEMDGPQIPKKGGSIMSLIANAFCFLYPRIAEEMTESAPLQPPLAASPHQQGWGHRCRDVPEAMRGCHLPMSALLGQSLELGTEGALQGSHGQGPCSRCPFLAHSLVRAKSVTSWHPEVKIFTGRPSVHTDLEHQ